MFIRLLDDPEVINTVYDKWIVSNFYWPIDLSLNHLSYVVNVTFGRRLSSCSITHLSYSLSCLMHYWVFSLWYLVLWIRINSFFCVAFSVRDAEGKTGFAGFKQQEQGVSLPASLLSEQETKGSRVTSRAREREWMGGCEVCDLHGAAAQCRPLAVLFLLQRLPRLHVWHKRASLQLLQAVPRKQEDQ